jgi:putative ABC transport system permease protein
MTLHRLLMRLYPKSFRHEYGEELRRVFERRRREADSIGSAALLWAGEIADTIGTAARVHADILRQDLRHTRRSLARSRGFAAAAILVTALGVGVTTAAFTVTDHVLLKPLPFAEPDRIAKLWESTPQYSDTDVSPANFRDWQARATSFSTMGAYTEGNSASLTGRGDALSLDLSLMSPNLTRLLGVTPEIGRGFLDSENAPGRASVVLLSDRLWRTAFNADPGVIGTTVTLDAEQWTVVGVMPASFQFPSRTTDVWIPLIFTEASFEDRSNQYLRVLGRLKPGVTREAARAEMATIAKALEREYPADNKDVGVSIVDLRDGVSRQSRMLLYTLVAASACILLIACTNLASLLVARASVRERELAVRAALGAGRERLVRQLLTEGAVIGALGGALGLAVAVLAVPTIVQLVPARLPLAAAPSLDLRMLAIAALVTAITVLGFGVLPAFRASRPSSSLKDGARATVSRHTERLRAGLVVAQVALSVVLLVGAALLVRALWRVQAVDPGFRADNVLTFRATLPTSTYGPQAKRVAFYRRVIDEVNAVPGVTGAAYTSWVPMTMRGGIWPVFLPGQPRDPNGAPSVSVRYVTDAYFDVMGTPLRIGRPFDARDSIDGEKTAIVSESFAKAHFPGEDPRGKRFFLAFFDRTIVGVVGDMRVRGLERESEPQVYLPYQQQLDDMMIFYNPKDLVVRLADPSQQARVTAAVREIVNKIEPNLPIADVRMLSAIVGSDWLPRETQVQVLGAFAGLACLLAAVGLHGLLAFIVNARSREIGVRLAMGAAPSQVLALITRRGFVLATAGVTIGAGLAYLAAHSMRALLAGIDPSDPVALAFAVGAALLGAAAGTMWPAIRAARTSPTEALRAE